MRIRTEPAIEAEAVRLAEIAVRSEQVESGDACSTCGNTAMDLLEWHMFAEWIRCHLCGQEFKW